MFGDALWPYLLSTMFEVVSSCPKCKVDPREIVVEEERRPHEKLQKLKEIQENQIKDDRILEEIFENDKNLVGNVQIAQYAMEEAESSAKRKKGIAKDTRSELQESMELSKSKYEEVGESLRNRLRAIQKRAQNSAAKHKEEKARFARIMAKVPEEHRKSSSGLFHEIKVLFTVALVGFSFLYVFRLTEQSD
eukprot:CAMPEP_0114992722 /NCGR_PEP_ID=MMETSP0216-20121206/12108_1 /TAXON_ID=223996 /ORGANISM="Protocruzia adherens, Strain Boccale" /LENGTH=191 /DNA_ID=CAMNT_0002356237 /DNA_START=427 /DNA_END=1003 /DNA_ORIENTATION=-